MLARRRFRSITAPSTMRCVGEEALPYASTSRMFVSSIRTRAATDDCASLAASAASLASRVNANSASRSASQSPSGIARVSAGSA